MFIIFSISRIKVPSTVYGLSENTGTN